MVDPAWAKAPLSYAGWVPNVGSHLSFSLIGSRAGKGVVRLSVRVRYSDRIARVVCAMQTRTTDDMLLPPSLALWLTPDLRQNWMLVGETETIDTPTGALNKPSKPTLGQKLRQFIGQSCETDEKVATASDEQGALIGRILIIPYEEDREARIDQENILENVRGDLLAAQPGNAGKIAIYDAEKTIRSIGLGVLTVNFALMRTGETRIWFHEEYDQFSQDDHYQIARQAYFFIKDMSHRHVHHDKLDDQITPLVPFRNTTPDERLDSEVEWRRETLWSLSRYADKRMGSDKLNHLREALGTLAYADAFQKTLLQHVRNPKDPLLYLTNKSAYGYDFQHIRESTRVRIDQTAAQRTVTGQLIAAIFAGCIASLSLASSLISTHNSYVIASNNGVKYHIQIWNWLLKILAERPVFAMAVSAYILYGAFALCLSDILFTKPRRRFQFIRGLTLSYAHKKGLDAESSFLILIAIYLVFLALLIALIPAAFALFNYIIPENLL